jgi:hypothetical protein
VKTSPWKGSPPFITATLTEMLATQITRTILSRSAIAFEMGLETRLQEQALQLVLQAAKQQARRSVDEDRRRGLAGMSLSCTIKFRR